VGHFASLANELKKKHSTAVIPSANRALANLQQHLPDPDAIDWNATLDEPAEELDWDI
jgi:hypothetical protein